MVAAGIAATTGAKPRETPGPTAVLLLLVKADRRSFPRTGTARRGIRPCQPARTAKSLVVRLTCAARRSLRRRCLAHAIASHRSPLTGRTPVRNTQGARDHESPFIGGGPDAGRGRFRHACRRRATSPAAKPFPRPPQSLRRQRPRRQRLRTRHLPVGGRVAVGQLLP